MTVVAFVVSNILLALVPATAAGLLQRRRPGLAHVLWLLVLVKLLTPPLVRVPLALAPGPWACTLGVCGCAHHGDAHGLVRDRLPGMLLGLWAAGAVVTAGIAGRRWLWLQRLTARARPAPATWQILAERLAAEFGLRRSPAVLSIPGRLPPLLVPGRGRPRLLLPRAFLDRLHGPGRDALLLHELAHVRRRDHWVRLLELAVHVAYWWLPGVGRIGRQLRCCEEACCDAAVVARRPHARRAYAELLLETLDFTSAAPAVAQATAMSAVHDLERRLRAILPAESGAARPGLAGLLTLALVGAVLPCTLRVGVAAGPAVPTAGVECAAPAAATPLSDGACAGTRRLYCCPS